MSNLSHYRKGTSVIICPFDKAGPVIEAKIIDKAQGRRGNKSLVKVQSDRALDAWGDKHKTAEGIVITPSNTAWLNPSEWEVIARLNG